MQPSGSSKHSAFEIQLCLSSLPASPLKQTIAPLIMEVCRAAGPRLKPSQQPSPALPSAFALLINMQIGPVQNACSGQVCGVLDQQCLTL